MQQSSLHFPSGFTSRQTSVRDHLCCTILQCDCQRQEFFIAQWDIKMQMHNAHLYSMARAKATSGSCAGSGQARSCCRKSFRLSLTNVLCVLTMASSARQTPSHSCCRWGTSSAQNSSRGTVSRVFTTLLTTGACSLARRLARYSSTCTQNHQDMTAGNDKPQHKTLEHELKVQWR